MYLKSCLVKRMVWYLRDACFKMVAVHDYNNTASTNCSDTEYLVFVPLTIRTVPAQQSFGSFCSKPSTGAVKPLLA